MEKHYETVFILNPVLSDSQIKEAVDKVKNFVTERKGSIVHTENWGLKKLAYSIEGKKSGFYSLIEFKVGGEYIKDLEILFKREEKIMRHIIVSMDKYEVAYAEKRRGSKKVEA